MPLASEFGRCRNVTTGQPNCRTAAGFSLVEVLLATVMAAALIAAMLRLYTDVRQTVARADQAIELTQRLAFALATLEEDILLSGYWGLVNNPDEIDVPAGLAISCSGNDVSGWALRLDEKLAAGPATLLPCPAFGSIVPATDTLVVRHVSRQSGAARAGSVQLQSTTTAGRVFNDGSVEADGIEQINNLNAHAWYVDTRSSEHGLPALRRQTLVHGGGVQNQEIMPAIEDMQIRLGVDSDADGYIDAFVAPEFATGMDVLAVDVTLTARSSQRIPGYADADGLTRLQANRVISIRNRGAV